MGNLFVRLEISLPQIDLTCSDQTDIGLSSALVRFMQQQKTTTKISTVKFDV